MPKSPNALNASSAETVTRLMKTAKAFNGKAHRITQMSKCTKCKLATCTNAQIDTMQTYQSVKITTLEIEKRGLMRKRGIWEIACANAKVQYTQKYKLAKCTNVQMHKMQTDKRIVKIVSMTKRPTVNMS